MVAGQSQRLPVLLPWRLRSQTTQAWLRETGIDAPLITGGYKALRRFLIDEMEACIASLPLEVLCGRTGCAKTRVIEQQPNAIDLEGLAHHRGSSFGRRPGGQPTQIDFENSLAIALLKQRAAQPTRILVEDESKLIGRCHLPFSLQDQIKSQPRIVIEESLAVPRAGNTGGLRDRPLARIRPLLR